MFVAMRKLLTAVLVLVAALAVTRTSLAAGKTGSTKSKASPHTVSGQIESYNDSAHQLTLKSGSSSMTFTVAPDAQVWAGKESLTLNQLSGKTGSKATVTYTLSGTEKTTHTIRLASGTKTTK
jgi:hypothetical protein